MSLFFISVMLKHAKISYIHTYKMLLHYLREDLMRKVKYNGEVTQENSILRKLW